MGPGQLGTQLWGFRDGRAWKESDGADLTSMGGCPSLAQLYALGRKLSRTQLGTWPTIWDQTERPDNRAVVRGVLGERSSTCANWGIPQFQVWGTSSGVEVKHHKCQSSLLP